MEPLLHMPIAIADEMEATKGVSIWDHRVKYFFSRYLLRFCSADIQQIFIPLKTPHCALGVQVASGKGKDCLGFLAGFRAKGERI